MLQSFVVRIIVWYQRYLSPDTGMFSLRRGTTCGFIPSCSEYTKQAIQKHGVVKGFFLGMKRIIRCHPWQTEHIDPLP